MSNADDKPLRSRADSILAEINPQRARKPLSSCPKCNSTNFTKGGGIQEMLMFRCRDCRYEFPLANQAAPFRNERAEMASKAPSIGPYDGPPPPMPERNAPTFRGRGKIYSFEDDE